MRYVDIAIVHDLADRQIDNALVRARNKLATLISAAGIDPPRGPHRPSRRPARIPRLEGNRGARPNSQP
jgi:hypothetical protein